MLLLHGVHCIIEMEQEIGVMRVECLLQNIMSVVQIPLQLIQTVSYWYIYMYNGKKRMRISITTNCQETEYDMVNL